MDDRLIYSHPVSIADDDVFGIAFSRLTGKQIARRLLSDPVPAGEGTRLLVTANVDHISNLVRNDRFRAAYDSSWLATADGMPVYLYARWRHCALPERVTGADLSTVLLDNLPPSSRPFFVVGAPRTADRLRQILASRGVRDDAIGFACPDFGFERNPAASAALAASIRNHRTTHLFFGLGAPKSEIWIHEHRLCLGDLYALPIGASLDFYVGSRRRAPVWMRRYGLEWAWRVMSEPARLLQRYCVESWCFLFAVMMDLSGRATTGAAARKRRSEPGLP